MLAKMIATGKPLFRMVHVFFIVAVMAVEVESELPRKRLSCTDMSKTLLPCLLFFSKPFQESSNPCYPDVTSDITTVYMKQ
jgi:hypothetical protein